MSLLDIADLDAGYGDLQVLDGVDLAVDAEEYVTIVGPNGAGKSTVMRSVFGLTTYMGGTITFDGEEITGRRPDEIIRRGIVYVPQNENVFPSLSVRENLEMGAYVLDEVPEDTMERVFERFPILRDRQEQTAGNMSGGQQQMVAMGAGLMIDPDILLVDEPSAGLAPDLVEDMFERIQRIKEAGTSILMIEQNARQALRYSDRGYVLDQGENAFEGPGEELLESEEIKDMYLGQAA